MQDGAELNWQRLPLTGAHNVRELGGFSTTRATQTRFHRFLRADNLCALTREDEAFLYDYGVRTVIDLRGSQEAQAEPDKAIGTDVAHYNFSLYDIDISKENDERGEPEATEDERRKAFLEGEQAPDAVVTIWDVYRDILTARDNMAAVFQTIAHAQAGCVIFHCAVGKDRTGVVAAFLMELAGCDRPDIVAQYTQTQDHLMRYEWYSQVWTRNLSEVGRAHMASDSALINWVLNHVDEHYAGVEGYLLDCGVSQEELDLVRARLLDE